MPLVEEYVRSERWKEAEPLAEMLVKKSKGRDRGEQHTLNKLLGRVHSALGSYEKALKSYQTANQLDLTDQDSIRGIADVAFELKEWATALTNYQKVLTALSEQDVEARTDVYYRLGCIKREQGQARQAINNFEKALGLNPSTARRSRRWSTFTRRTRTGSRSRRTSGRSSTASSTATSATRS